MQIENDYEKEVYNGDIGYIDNVDTDTGELTASFDGRAVTYGYGEHRRDTGQAAGCPGGSKESRRDRRAQQPTSSLIQTV